MATLVLQQSRSTFFPALRPWFSRTSLATVLTPAWSIPSLQSLLDLFPPFLLAVPKKKTSHSRKAMRSANKGLKDKENIVNCPGCGSPKLAHHLCSNCYASLSRTWKAQKREGGIPDLS
ncbi:hypothetical protein M378DRAFT_66559 [Amanita muscaria Koide BX008]|uniref:Large ribosomal subunit protein bL32m n=1 Tax=Amanita muscaria (strain Koide BX008) TaxID=946122 RepID=A0A0C2XNP9_AMAMK|nr:hypothetical protein M378DRAFT_66559 [Amanita muscaria Koide BX008]